MKKEQVTLLILPVMFAVSFFMPNTDVLWAMSLGGMSVGFVFGIYGYSRETPSALALGVRQTFCYRIYQELLFTNHK